MHFMEALDLAQHIRRTRPSWLIVAIGRFKPPAEIRLGMPWGISVLEPGEDKPRVIWRREDLDGPPPEGSEGQTQAASPAAEEPVPGMLF